MPRGRGIITHCSTPATHQSDAASNHSHLTLFSGRLVADLCPRICSQVNWSGQAVRGHKYGSSSEMPQRASSVTMDDRIVDCKPVIGDSSPAEDPTTCRCRIWSHADLKWTVNIPWTLRRSGTGSDWTETSCSTVLVLMQRYWTIATGCVLVDAKVPRVTPFNQSWNATGWDVQHSMHQTEKMTPNRVQLGFLPSSRQES